MYSELLVRYLASKQLNISFSDIVFAKNSYGKPYLSDYPEFHFNVSHSCKYLVVLVSNQPVGVDIEKIDNPNLNIAHRFFLKKRKHIFLLIKKLLTNGLMRYGLAKRRISNIS